MLKTSLDNYVRSRFRHEQAKKRSPGTSLQDVDECDGLARMEDDPAGPLDVDWARQIIRRAVGMMETPSQSVG